MNLNRSPHLKTEELRSKRTSSISRTLEHPSQDGQQYDDVRRSEKKLNTSNNFFYSGFKIQPHRSMITNIDVVEGLGLVTSSLDYSCKYVWVDSHMDNIRVGDICRHRGGILAQTVLNNRVVVTAGKDLYMKFSRIPVSPSEPDSHSEGIFTLPQVCHQICPVDRDRVLLCGYKKLHIFNI